MHQNKHFFFEKNIFAIELEYTLIMWQRLQQKLGNRLTSLSLSFSANCTPMSVRCEQKQLKLCVVVCDCFSPSNGLKCRCLVHFWFHRAHARAYYLFWMNKNAAQSEHWMVRWIAIELSRCCVLSRDLINKCLNWTDGCNRHLKLNLSFQFTRSMFDSFQQQQRGND